MKRPLVELPISTPDGEFTARYSEKGLAELGFPKVGRASSRAENRNGITAKIRDWHRLVESALKSIFAGKRPEKFPPLDAEGTEFQKSVWREMRKIPPGRTKSYGEVAAAIGKPKAVRAVGGACGANPIPVLVPCHRVLAANGIGGFGGGLDWKRKLLTREKVNLPSAG